MSYHHISFLKQRHSLWLMLACVVLLIFPCCMKNIKKTHLSELENKEGIFLKKGEGVFTGKAWSSDNKTVCLECDTGRPVSIFVYYENGSVATKMIFSGDAVFDDVKQEVKMFDKRGNQVTEEELLQSVEGQELFKKMIVYFREIDK